MKIKGLFLVFSLSLLAAFSAVAGGKDTRPATASNAVHPATAEPPVVVAQPSLEPLAYLLAWRSATDATHHADALHLTKTMADLVGLPTGPAYDALERLLDAELAASPGRFNAMNAPFDTLSQLLKENVGGFQRILSPALSEDGYERYQKLLDSLDVKAQ